MPKSTVARDISVFSRFNQVEYHRLLHSSTQTTSPILMATPFCRMISECSTWVVVLSSDGGDGVGWLWCALKQSGVREVVSSTYMIFSKSLVHRSQVSNYRNVPAQSPPHEWMSPVTETGGILNFRCGGNSICRDQLELFTRRADREDIVLYGCREYGDQKWVVVYVARQPTLLRRRGTFTGLTTFHRTDGVRSGQAPARDPVSCRCPYLPEIPPASCSRMSLHRLRMRFMAAVGFVFALLVLIASVFLLRIPA